MKAKYTADMSFFVEDGRLPLAVRFIDGRHPEKLFHAHEFMEVVIITSGRPLHIAGDESCEAEKGDVLVIQPGTVHGYDRTAGAGILNLIFDSDKLPVPQLDGGEFSLFGKFFPGRGESYISAKPVAHLPEEILEQIVSVILRIDEETRSVRPGSMFYAMGLFIEALSIISRAGSMQIKSEHSRFMLENALRYINKNFQKQITLSELARVSCMSERNFQRRFRQALGQSPMQYLMGIRLRRVQEQLLTDDTEIGVIALNCGFYDSNYLCKKFRRAFRMTPSEFRRRSRKAAGREA